MALRVALADDNLIVREGISRLLADASSDIEVVAECSDLPSVLAAVEEHDPDVVLTDIRMPPSFTDEGIRLAARLRVDHPRTGVVVLSNYANPMYALALLDSGSEGRSYLLKERVHDRAQLVSAIYSVAAGGSMMDPKIVEPLIAARTYGLRSPLADLTTREREVLSEIAQGASNAAIAESLVLTKRAVEKHINSIFMKLNLADAEDVSKRVKAALVFLAEADRH
jgi:DNA-binding NarL/FixJ family response regulator